MPNHCWQTSNIPNVPTYGTVDFEVAWNPASAGDENYTSSQFNSVSATSNVLCDISRTGSSHMNAWSAYEEFSARRLRDGHNLQQPPQQETWGTMSGVAVTGGVILNGLSSSDEDAVTSEIDTLDNCLMHASPQGQWHYHSLSPCATDSTYKSTSAKPGLCADNADCTGEAGLQFMKTGWDTTTNNGGVYGLAKDGHVIYGPYNNNLELWSCEDVDVCNGFWVWDGSYGYASTSHFPYIVGCWGPGPAVNHGVTCSENGCGTGGGADGHAMNLISTSAVAVAVFAMSNVF